ncbi:MAG: hypothetical protein NT007_03980 [Candidatus Kapabacteria bacterium]|nr:hypothetical protein [Candidatus Kapabacteria bacterium]
MNPNFNILKAKSIVSFSVFLSLFVYHNLTIAQIVNFKPETYYSNSDLWNDKYKLNIDSVEFYSYFTKSKYIVKTFNNVDLINILNINGYSPENNLSINKLEIINTNLLINYTSYNNSASNLQIIDLNGSILYSSFYLTNSIQTSIDFSKYANGTYFINIACGTESINYPIIYLNDEDLCFIPYFEKTLINEGMYRFTGYSKNRPAVIIDSLSPKDGDTIKFPFKYEKPFCFRNCKLTFDLPDCRVFKTSQDAIETKTDTIYGVYLEQNFQSFDIIRSTDSNYYIGFDEAINDLHTGKESASNGAYVRFKILNDSLVNIYVHTAKNIIENNLNWNYLLHFQILTAQYQIVNDNLIIDLNQDTLPNNIFNIEASAKWISQFPSMNKGGWKMDKVYSFVAAVVHLVLQLY